MSLRSDPDLPALLRASGSAGGLLGAPGWGRDDTRILQLPRHDEAAGALPCRDRGTLVVPGNPGLAASLRRRGAWLVLAWRRGQLACMLTP